jgi:hypothetical protein
MSHHFKRAYGTLRLLSLIILPILLSGCFFMDDYTPRYALSGGASKAYEKTVETNKGAVKIEVETHLVETRDEPFFKPLPFLGYAYSRFFYISDIKFTFADGQFIGYTIFTQDRNFKATPEMQQKHFNKIANSIDDIFKQLALSPSSTDSIDFSQNAIENEWKSRPIAEVFPNNTGHITWRRDLGEKLTWMRNLYGEDQVTDNINAVSQSLNQIQNNEGNPTGGGSPPAYESESESFCSECL